MPCDWRPRPRHHRRKPAGRYDRRPAPRASAPDCCHSGTHFARGLFRREVEARRDHGWYNRMRTRIAYIASNTFREAVRDRVLYNLIAFALLLSGAAILVGQISI